MSEKFEIFNLDMKVGDTLKVKGKISGDAEGFSINLGSSSSDLALHFNPRFTETVIVCNSRCGNAWQAEHRDHHFCFSRDSTVKVRALWGCWGVFVGGKTQVSRLFYPLRLPLPHPHPLGFGSWLLFPLPLQFPNLSLSSCALIAPRFTLTIRPPSPPAGDAALAALSPRWMSQDVARAAFRSSPLPAAVERSLIASSLARGWGGGGELTVLRNDAFYLQRSAVSSCSVPLFMFMADTPFSGSR
uniref:Galectin n=1 Tax=Anas platyrhynchos platyrhynchos TaxID=8840 RepID=A0A493TEK8_ANAPP